MITNIATIGPARCSVFVALVTSTIAILVALQACSSSPYLRDSPSSLESTDALIRYSRVEVTVLLVGVDVGRAERSLAYRRLLECARLTEYREGRVPAQTWSEIEGHVRTLRAQNAALFAVQPSLRIRSGARSTIEMQGAFGAKLTVSVRAAERPTGGATVDVGARFTGDARDNRFEDFEFSSGQFTLTERRVHVGGRYVEGAEMLPAAGQPKSSQDVRVLMFVSAEAVVH